MSDSQFSVAQLGARRHYAAPRLLCERGLLCRLFTDLSAANWPLAALRSLPAFASPRSFRRLAERVPLGIPPNKISSFLRFGLHYSSRPPTVSRSQHWIKGGKEFCNLVLRHGLGEAAGIYTFTGAGLELLEWAKSNGVAGVHDQIMASRRTEQTLIARQQGKFPQWSEAVDQEDGIEEYCQREAAEWDAASLVLCGSEFVRDSIVAEGADPSRCVVMPYGSNPAFASHSKPERTRLEPLRVLVVGEVGLRKGSPYVFKTAQALTREIQVRMVGKVSCPVEIASNAPLNLRLVGVAPRSEMLAHYAWADVLLLPSICEGSAGSIFEALASGIPVICTPNSGSIVEHGVCGLIIPAEDEDAVIAAICRLAGDRELLRQMSKEAKTAAAHWSLSNYGDRLAQTLLSHVASLADWRNRKPRSSAHG